MKFPKSKECKLRGSRILSGEGEVAGIEGNRDFEAKIEAKFETFCLNFDISISKIDENGDFI